MKYYCLSKGDYAPTYYFTVDDEGNVDLMAKFSLPSGYGRSKHYVTDMFKPQIPQHYIDYITKEFNSADKSKWWGGYEMTKKDFDIMRRMNERK